MSETLTKLRPDRDLQCYFQRPSAIAALSSTGPAGFIVSGTWRQQFDWAVVEWNRDNVFEHPQLRNLPDGDLSGITLTYEEERNNCICADSTLYPTVDWPSLRIWADPGTGEQVYKVPLMAHAEPKLGKVGLATAIFTLGGLVTPGDVIELAWDQESHDYTLASDDTVDTAAAALAIKITGSSTTVSAEAEGPVITLKIRPDVGLFSGANGNRIGAYAVVSGAGGTEYWNPQTQNFRTGESPSKWRFSIDFSVLKDEAGNRVPTHNIRKMRWTYAAALQPEAYQRSEFQVCVSAWSVVGTGLTYSVAGAGSRRIDDGSSSIVYSQGWTASSGNFSCGTIHSTQERLATFTCQFNAERTFDVYLGTRKAGSCGRATVIVDGSVVLDSNLCLPLEDVLVRLQVATVQPGPHILTVQHTGPDGSYLYFDFVDLVVPTTTLPTLAICAKTTLATDWDTDHSIALSPERTAWLIYKLGYRGRSNHYVGALWFYELTRLGHVYSSASIQFGGSVDPTGTTTLFIGLASSGFAPDAIAHRHLSGDTIETIAKALELRINSGYTSIWAKASGSALLIQSRFMGTDGNNITVDIATVGSMTATKSSSHLQGGENGDDNGVSDSPDSGVSADYRAANQGWRTDINASPRLNPAARDWTRSFVAALNGYGIDATAAFSMELQHGDPSQKAGIAQRYYNKKAAILKTPALQTNFSPTSLVFWQQVYLEMAAVMTEAGQTPYLQFGEVQWWYFPDPSSLPPAPPSLPFYDTYTTSQFSYVYDDDMGINLDNLADPAKHTREAAFLPSLIGSFTRSIQQFVRQTYPATRFEVLYPCDTNDYPFTRVINFASDDWTASTLDCLKTENFTYTGSFNLKLAANAVRFPMQHGFPTSKASHLIGISDPASPWQREADTVSAEGLESTVLFALDQYCLIGYSSEARQRNSRSFMIP